MREAERLNREQLITFVGKWCDEHIGVLMVESRPHDIYHAWIEEVYKPDELPRQLRDFAFGALKAFGSMRVEISSDPEGNVRLVRVAKRL